MALKDPVTKICIIGTLMPTVLNKMVIPVRATKIVIHVFRICIRDIPDTLLRTNIKPTINIFSSNRKNIENKNNKLRGHYSIF